LRHSYIIPQAPRFVNSFRTSFYFLRRASASVRTCSGK